MHYSVYTLNGRSVFTQEGGSELNLKALPKGMYLLVVKKGIQKRWEKIILR